MAQALTLVAVTRSDLVATVHVLAVVVAFGGALAYPVWFRMVRDATPEQRAFFHRAQARLGKFLITPAILVVFATGAYLASDLDVWGEAWVLIPTAIVVVILALGGAFLGPSEERLSREAECGDQATYDVRFRRVRLVTWSLVVLVVVAALMMVARVPDGGGGNGSAAASPGASVAIQAGCLACHRIGSEGRARPGGDLSDVGARLAPADLRERLIRPPSGMPSFDTLPAEKIDALVSYLSQLR